MQNTNSGVGATACLIAFLVIAANAIGLIS
jgi:hypothetical protein